MTTARTPTPNPKILLRRVCPTAHAALLCVLLCALPCAGAASAQTHGASEEVIETAQTPAGELSLVRRRAGEGVTIVIRLAGKVVAEKEASEEGDAYNAATIHGLYPSASPRYAVVKLLTGSLVCGSKTTVVDLSGGEAAKATKDFGNCSDSPRVAYRRDSLTITFTPGPRKHDPGAHYVGPGQVWSYGGGRLRRVAGRR